MYVPVHFAHDDRSDVLAVMREHNFATLVSTVNGMPFATHAPVLVHEDGADRLRIEGHVAAANPHGRALADDAQVLVVFCGPHTYVSPTRYRSPHRVPTWNYIAVHATGRATRIADAESKLAILARLIAVHEPDFAARFATFAPDLRDSLVGAIVGFEIAVDRLESKFKLGQNRLSDNLPSLQTEYENGRENERELAAWMKRLGYWS